jgi:hypothetical protein
VTSFLPQDPYQGVFSSTTTNEGRVELRRHPHGPPSLIDPLTGRALRIATVEVSGGAICPACAQHSDGGFVSFVADARMVYACPACRKLIWLSSV